MRMVRYLYSAILLLSFSGCFSQEYFFEATGGKAYRLYIVPDSNYTPQQKQHQEDLKPGNTFGIEAYRMDGGTGIGFGFSSFRGNRITYYEGKSAYLEDTSVEQVIINSYSFNYYLRKNILTKKLFLTGKVGLSYVTLNNYLKTAGDEHSRTAGTFSIGVYIGLKYIIHKHFAVGLNSGIFISKTDKVKTDGVEQILKKNLSLTYLEGNLSIAYIL